MIVALSLSVARSIFGMRLGGRGTTSTLAGADHSVAGILLPDADLVLDERFDFTSPAYDWSRDEFLCEERAMQSLDDDSDSDEFDWELAADLALRAAESDHDPDDDEDDDPRPIDEDDDRD